MWPLQQVPFLSPSESPNLGWWAPGMCCPAGGDASQLASPSTISSRTPESHLFAFFFFLYLKNIQEVKGSSA